jgi:hypothetical protein
MRSALVILMATGIASGQISINNHATGTPLPNPFILPDAPVNDADQFQIDVVNTGTTAATVNSAAVFGEYYTLCCETAFTLAPAGIQTLTLAFSPLNTGFQSGSLQIAGQTILLFAQGVPAASLFLQTAGGTLQAHVNSPLAFSAATPSLTQLPCILENNWSGAVTVNSISVTGGWILSGTPSTPLVLQAGQQVTFTLQAGTASSDGSVSGVLAIDQWSYPVTAQPAQPAMQIRVASPLQSAQQSSIAIAFNPAPTRAITGTVQLSFHSSTTISLTDPAIIFPSSGTATVEFTSVPGQSLASFGGAASATFQTGTTAGMISVTSTWGTVSETSNVAITAEPIAIESVTGTRESDALDVTVTGYDNTRTAGVMSFSFFDSQGEFIGQSVNANFTEAFYTYFFQDEYNAGGMFKLTAHFPVTGNPGTVSSVQVDLMNSAGDAQSSPTKF